MANAEAYKELTPHFFWFEDSSSHYLILDLPGFRREEIKVEVDNEGHLNISGDRKMNESEYIFFQQSFNPPENSRPETATVLLEEDILYISISKQATEKEEGEKIPPGNPVQEQNQQNQSNKSSDEIDSEHENDKNRYDSCCSSDEEDEEEEEFHDAKAMHNLKQETMLPMGADKLRRNSMIVTVVILAISLGVLVIHNKPTAMNYD